MRRLVSIVGNPVEAGHDLAAPPSGTWTGVLYLRKPKTFWQFDGQDICHSEQEPRRWKD